MLDLIVTFKEPIYTRKSILNHDYDITLNEIAVYSKSKIFSDAGYCFALLYRIKLYGRHEKKMFLDFQLTLSKDPQRWLLNFERLVELMCSPAAFTFIYYSSEDLKDVPKIISELFTDIENEKYQSSTKETLNEVVDNETIFNTKEASSYLNIAKSTLYKLTSKKAITFYKPNRKNMYFKKGDLDVYLTQVKHISNSDLETKTNDYLSRNWKL